MASLARIFSTGEIEALVEELSEEKISELSVLIEGLGKSRLMDILQETESPSEHHFLQSDVRKRLASNEHCVTYGFIEQVIGRGASEQGRPTH